MNTAQKFFVATSWLFLVLSGLLFLVPTDFPSAQGAAWAALAVGIVSHVALLAALVYDQIPQSDSPPIEG